MRSIVSDVVSGVVENTDQRSRAVASISGSCSTGCNASASQLRTQIPQDLQASGLMTIDSSSAPSFFTASASWKNGCVTATGSAPSSRMMAATPSSMAFLRSSSSGILSVSQAYASSRWAPKSGATSSDFLFAAMIRVASFDATGRTASALPSRMPASISAAGAEETTPIALSGQFVQHLPQPVHGAGSKTGIRERLPLVVLNVALSGGIVPVARNGSAVSLSASPSRYSTPA